MTRRPLVLRPQDVAVALQLALAPYTPLAELAWYVRLSLGEVHNSVQRLRAARLIRPRHRYADRRALLEFVIHGVPYAYPGIPGAGATGVPTAHSGPALSGRVQATRGQDARAMVWPSERGGVHGIGLIPLYPRATELPEYNPDLYRWLTLVDALRAGQVRARVVARAILEAELGEGALPLESGDAPRASG